MRYSLYFLFVIGILVVFISITTIIKQPAPHIPSVENGVLDLIEVEDLNTSIVQLDGTWEFYWQIFTQSQENIGANNTYQTTMYVPGSWEVSHHSEENITNFGYGTYKLKILLPENELDKTYGLYITSVATSYKLWIDDEFIISNGEIGTNRKEMHPVNYARTAYFHPKDHTIDITIEVANFSQRKSGLWESIYFGSAEEISLLREKNVALQLLVVGSLVIMGIYNIFICLLRRTLIYSMFLGILCLMFAIRTLLIGDAFLIYLFPHFPWELQVKLEYLPTVFGLPLMVKYVNELYEEKKFILFEKIVLFFSIVFGIFVLVTPAFIYTKYLLLFLIVVPITLIYFGYIFLNAFYEKKPASLFTLIGFTIFIVTVISDSLYFFNFVNNGLYLSNGFLIFLLSQTFAHAIKFSETHAQVENLTDKLLEANRSLEKKVKDRTKELSHLYTKLRKSEHERKNLMSDLAHEISKPLTLIKGYSEAMVDEKLTPEKDYLQIIYRNANISERLIHDLSELSKLETRQLKMIFQKVELKNYPYNIFQHHKWTVERKGKHFKWKNEHHWSDQAHENVYLYIDPDRMNQVYINIIENALYHGEKGENIFIEFELSRTNNMKEEAEEVAATTENRSSTKQNQIGEFIIKITDEGKGIPEEDLPYIFNRLYRGTNDKDGISSSGLGLAISKEIVEMHGGNIWVESELGEDSTFYVSLPVYQL